MDRTRPLCLMKKWSRYVFNALFPPRCISCGRVLPGLLTDCRSDPEPGGARDPVGAAGFFCRDCRRSGYRLLEAVCRDKEGNPVFAAAAYEGIVRSGLHGLKYANRQRAALFFEPFFYDAFERGFASGDIDLIVPIPLHTAKLRQRGFNQSFLLVRRFERLYRNRHGHRPGWHVDPFCITRTRNTRSQTRLSFEQRKKNVTGAFAVVDPRAVAGRQILLVDDVFTTGATAGETARMLRQHKAAGVHVLVLARA